LEKNNCLRCASRAAAAFGRSGRQFSPGRKPHYGMRNWRQNIMNTLAKLTTSTAPNAAILIRLMVGAVFLSEGI
jgi:hypothetical protein